MVGKLINEIEQEISNILNNIQMEELHKVLVNSLGRLESNKEKLYSEKEMDYLSIFICAKQVEGCSEKSIKYYKSTIENMLKIIEKNIKYITTEDLREYLADYQKKSLCSKVNLDNIRRILSSFFFMA